MKKLLTLALGLSPLGACAPAALRAADADTGGKKRPKLIEDQRKLRKEMVEKYDTNKDGKLNKEERAKISKEDKEKLEKAGLGARHKKGEGHNKTESPK